MADGFEVDFSELDKLSADLGEIEASAGPLIRKAVEITALKSKRDWQEPLKGSATLPLLPYALSYDVRVNFLDSSTTVEAEVGFDKTRAQGALGNISEYGSPSITGRGFGLAALEKNLDDFIGGIDLAMRDAERKAGL